MTRTTLALTILGFTLLLGGCSTTAMKHAEATVTDVPTGFLNKSMTVGEVERTYVVYVPRDYDPARQWPLVVFLHGMGERGNDGLLAAAVGIGHAIRFHQDRFPCVVVMPQCPADRTWVAAFPHIDEALRLTREEYSIDPERITLTGLSMGGYGAWAYGARHNEVFAALMPICGGGKAADAPALAQLPIWAFHGDSDGVVSPEESRKMVKAVQEAGGDVRYTEYPGVGHNSWSNAYGDPEAIAWLLGQKRKT